MFNHPLSDREPAPSSQTMSKSSSEDQGSVLQSWQQPETLQPGNEIHSNNAPVGQSQFSLKRKQRASAQDWFEERQSQRPKNIATGSNGVQLGTTASEPNSRNPRLRFTEQATPLPQHTPLAKPQPHQTYSHTHPESSQAHSPTADHSLSGSTVSGKMPNWRPAERYNRRDYGDTGRRSPSRDPRMNFGQDRRPSYPYPPPPPPPLPRSTVRRGSGDRGNFDRRSPPPSRREEDRDRPRDHREYRDRNDRGGLDVGHAPTGPRGTFQCFQASPDVKLLSPTCLMSQPMFRLSVGYQHTNHINSSQNNLALLESRKH